MNERLNSTDSHTKGAWERVVKGRYVVVLMVVAYSSSAPSKSDSGMTNTLLAKGLPTIKI